MRRPERCRAVHMRMSRGLAGFQRGVNPCCGSVMRLIRALGVRRLGVERRVRVARAVFIVDRLLEIFHDPALGAAAVVRVATVAQRAQLLFERAHRFDLLMNARDLAVDQLVHFVARLARVRLKASQRADVRETDAQRTAMADEVQLCCVRGRIAAVAVGFARGFVEQTLALVEAHGFHVAVGVARQFTDSHRHSSQKWLDPVATTGCPMILSSLGELGHGSGILVAVGARSALSGARRCVRRGRRGRRSRGIGRGIEAIGARS
ncbi:hypothetical protein PT2222_30008 [Paraburkholderia tropica]